MIEDFKIMIIDDDEKVIKVLQSQLEEEYSIIGYTNVFEALNYLKKKKVDFIILDYLLIDIRGDEVVEQIRKISNDIYIFLLTGCDKETLLPMNALKNIDIQFYCEKSADIEKMLLNIIGAIKSIQFNKNKINDSFGDRLRKLREEKDVSQKDIADYLGVGRSAIANWETNFAEPNNENLRKLSFYFKVSIDYLLCNDLFKT